MIIGDVFRKFAWRDKSGLIWNVVVSESITQVSWHVCSRRSGVVGKAHVQIKDLNSSDLKTLLHLPIARLIDLKVCERAENRDVGSMLVEQVIEECKRRGHHGLE